MEMPHNDSSTNLERLLKNRKRVRLPFVGLFPIFFTFLSGSYLGIFFVTYAIFSSSNISTSFTIARFWTQRCVGIINLAAFISFWVQAHGLIGSKGIKPMTKQLQEVRKLDALGKLNVSKYEYHPTLFWISSSDSFLHFVCFLGCLSSLCILSPCYISTTPFFIICAICYGSVKTMGAEFMQLQWDSMLVEINVICLWFEFDSLLSLRTTTDIWIADSYSSRIGIIMIYWLHYRLMMSAGFVKLSSGCPKWRDGTAMHYHFWTQPIPSPTSYIAWKCGLGCKASTYASILSEIIVPPLLFFIPFRICRLIACANTVGLMLLIFCTGNFGFFNLLTALLGISCMDDGLWPAFMDPIHSWLGFDAGRNVVFYYNAPDVFCCVISFLWFIMILIVSLRSLWHVSYHKLPLTGDFRLFVVKMAMWSIVNSYGLFARMTTFRHELIFQGTMDDADDYADDEDEIEWKTYEFKYKPDDINRRPPFALSHLPRLDWRLWFLPLRTYNKYNDAWLLQFVKKLIKNERECATIQLLHHNPFKQEQLGGAPVKAIRILQYEYRFVGDACDDEFGAKALELSEDELEWEQGRWWIRRDLKSKYIPIVTQEDVLNEEELKQLNANGKSNNDKYQCLDDASVNTKNKTKSKMETLLNDN